MRGKRSKQYRKLMQQYGLHFGFREPYQVLLDAEILKDAARFKMDFLGGLEKTLHGAVKPLITQCSIRHLYNAEPKDDMLIEHAKGFERRRCNHHTLEEPLTTFQCLSEVVDPKGIRTNKHRYVVASQDERLRTVLRRIPGVPMIYLKRSVMIMEPMANATEDVRQKDERSKFRQGLKRKRGTEAIRTLSHANEGKEELDSALSKKSEMEETRNLATQTTIQKASRKRGPSNPNPLSVKKPKKRPSISSSTPAKPLAARKGIRKTLSEEDSISAPIQIQEFKKTRRKRHLKPQGPEDAAGEATNL